MLGDVAIQRLDNVAIVVDDLDAAPDLAHDCRPLLSSGL